MQQSNKHLSNGTTGRQNREDRLAMSSFIRSFLRGIAKFTTAPQQHRTNTPIGPEDVVTIRGRYFYKGDARFFVKGIAFPNIPGGAVAENKNATSMDGWIAVLEQLTADMPELNTVRIYEMDCYQPEVYDAFFKRAAELGVYVAIPMTASSGDGNLNRERLPPKCYPPGVFRYGSSCMDNFWDRHPNVLMGVVGNEVMKSIEYYGSAPCVKAYLNDLTAYGRKKQKSSKSSFRETFPLLYASQHDSPTRTVPVEQAIKLTLDYLACDDDDKNSTEQQDATNSKSVSVVDPFVFGINIESWCSSSETFLDDHGRESTYHGVWRAFSGMNKTVRLMDAVTTVVTIQEIPPLGPEPVAIPVVFSEMGCSRSDFNKDNRENPVVPLEEQHIRDWKQIPLVSSPNGAMTDLWSGFVAYGYDGGGDPAFDMMGDGDSKGNVTWNGKDVLSPSKEYENFRDAMNNIPTGDDAKGGIKSLDRTEDSTMASRRHESCSVAVERIKQNFGVELFPLSSMPSYDHEIPSPVHEVNGYTLYFAVLIVLFFCWVCSAQRSSIGRAEEKNVSTESAKTNYGTV